MVSTKFTYLSWLRHDNYVDVVVDTIHVASMDEIYVTYVDDEHADNPDHDDHFYQFWSECKKSNFYKNNISGITHHLRGATEFSLGQ